MKKKHFSQQFLCVVLAILAVLSLMGCHPSTIQPSETDSDQVPFVSGISVPFTEEKKEEINEAWKAKTGHLLSWEGLGGCVYYATYGDIVVFFVMGQAPSMTTKTIAGHDFIYGSSFSIWVYHDGDFTYLEDAYEDGYITKSQIKELAEYHKSLNELHYDE